MTASSAPEIERRASSGALAATCISTLVVNANTSAVAILLPAISEDVDAPLSTLQWAVTGYMLVGAAFIVTSGALGDVFGRRRTFIGGLILFIASCFLIALSSSGAGVVIGRAIQGAAGATIVAGGLSLLTVATSGSERLRAVTLWGAASAIGAAAGPLVGGVLVEATGWQGLFWIDAFIAAVCIPLTLRTLGESRDPDRPRSIDWFGTLLVAAILGPVILALSEGADWGWTSPATLGCVLISVAAAAAFVYVEGRSPTPLIDLALLRNSLLIGGTLGILIGAGTINGLMFLVSIYFQDPSTFDMSPLQAGLATLPATVGLVVLSPAVPKLAVRLRIRTVVAVGFAIMTGGFAVLIATQASWSYAAFVLPLVAVAAGLALSNGPCSSVATSAVPAAQVGSASGVSNMARYVGAAVMTAVVAAVYAAVSANRIEAGDSRPDALASGFAWAAVVMTVTAAAGIALALLIARHRAPQPLPVDYAAAAVATSHTLPTPAADERTPSANR